MLFSSWLRRWKRNAPAARRRTQTSVRQRAGFRPRLEALEDRWLPSTLTVTNTHDSGSGSLRAEIAAAQSGDTIVFAPQLSQRNHTIALTSGELDLTMNLTIEGPAAGRLTISNSSGTVFEVAQNSTVTLSGLKISKSAEGILNHGTLTVSGCTVSGNGNNYGILVGGIYNDGTLTVSGSTVSGNGNSYGFSGGGIYNDGALTVSGCTISANEAFYGGGIFNASQGTATLIGSTVSGNQAVRDSFSDSYFQDPEGGGIYNDGTLTVSGCTVSRNNANYGGGGILNGGTLTVENSSSISGNTAGHYGADVYNLGVLYLDSTSTIGKLDGNPANSI